MGISQLVLGWRFAQIVDYSWDIIFSASVVAEFDSTENGGTIETVTPKYAEIIVIRHGETEWNTNRRIQVCEFFIFWVN